ncbi:MAG: CBS domain-containing protein [Candidatus Bathyarchaeia archaeon]
MTVGLPLPSLEEIAKRRRSLGLNQRELARLSGVSQSFVAKIEAGKINPSYELAKALFDVLERLESREELKAMDVMHPNVTGIDCSAAVSDASELMGRTGYSQLPVYKEGKVIGSVSEGTIIGAMLKVRDPVSLSEMTVEEIMEESFPLVDGSTPVNLISTLLRYTPAVLVTLKGEVKGIITKADLLKIVTRRG